ncbi:AI-2E family transporter [Sphingomonas nostoxanthinifaciens]|uniref:AI-2E family transporter n=1 Tax=Sphingomonas nostoxanthinifaciens TaxID=2872652 RepID=UPI001CC1E161|nr:AI-2E family transporter [Sphingomonas nostoxanthinifaciens]UAK25634.1 AI-2E family transporter [Sphingomonas nostoxanthinifaciens]
MPNPDNIAGYEDILTGSHEAPAPAEGAAQIAGSSAPELKSLLGIAVGTLVIAALYFGKEVLIPITLAVMLSFVLSPVVNFLQRLRLWRAPAVILTVLAALALLGLVGTVIGSQAASLTANAPQYAQTIEAKVEGVRGFAVAKVAAITQQLGSPRKAPPAAVAPTTAPPASNMTASTGAAGGLGTPAPTRRPIPVEVVQGQASPFTIAHAVLAPILSPLETTVLVLIVAIFVLMQKEDLRDRFIRLFGSNDLHRTTRAMDDAGQRLSKYFLSQLAVNTCFGIVIGLGLWAIGIPSPAMWGLMAGLLRFVPYIGSLIAAVAPAALGAAIDPGWAMAIEVVALFFVVEPFTGYVVEPMLYGHSTGLSPVSVIVSAIFWTWVWGPIGLIMSTPLTLCLVVMGRHVKSLEFFDVLLGDRPALTPVESFYQRILADNPDEALAQAELLLADRPLIDYYEDVVLQGLKLAVEDQAKGTIDKARAAKMTRSMLSVIDDLDDHVDEGSATLSSARSDGTGQVACVSGRGPFDDAVSTMLQQLLKQRGVASRTISNAQVSREAIAQLDLSSVAAIAISYLELVGSPAELRYLIKRLRQRAPAAKILVGLWPEGEAALSDTTIQRAIGADTYAGSLHAAVEAALSALGRDVQEPAQAA